MSGEIRKVKKVRDVPAWYVNFLPRFRTFALLHCLILSRLNGMWITGDSQVYALDRDKRLKRKKWRFFLCNLGGKARRSFTSKIEEIDRRNSYD